MTILVVDDHEENLYQLQVLLGGNGYQVVTAANGAEALAEARRNPPALIVSDILMPVMDGFSLCREWKKDERLKAIPFVFYTATYTDERDREFALGLGAQRFIVKPEEPDAFIRTLREAIEETQHLPSEPVLPPDGEPEAEETGYLKEYNEVLVRKLERKMEQLEHANRALEEDVAARRIAEEALGESEERYRLLVASSLDAVLLTLPEGRILSANPAACRMFGRPEEQLTQLGRSAVVDASDPRLALALDERARTGLVRCELTLIRSDGSKFPAELSSSLFRSREGQVRSSMVIRDITEQRRAQESLRESEVRFRSYFESSGAGCAITSPTTGWVEVNDRLCKMLGYSREEILHTTWTALTHPEDLEVDLEHFERVVAKEIDGYSIDKRFIRKDGESIWTSLSVRCVRLADGGIDYFVALLFDISERKQAEAELRFRTLLLSTQQEASLDGILVVDENGLIVSFNHRLVEMWGLPPESIEARADTRALGCAAEQVADPGSFLQRVQYLYEHPREISREEIGLKDGRTFDRYSAPMFGSDNYYYGRVWYFRDITDRKVAETRVAEQLDELRRWHQATLGREGRILELKKEVNELMAKADQPSRYPSAVEKDE